MNAAWFQPLKHISGLRTKQYNLHCQYFFPAKISSCMLSLSKRLGPVDKLSCKSNDSFSKAFVCSALQHASFSATMLSFFQSVLNTLSLR